MYPDNVPTYIDLFVSANPGVGEGDLREFLEGAGWSEQDIEKGIAHFKSRRSKAPAQAAAQAPVQSPTQPPVQAPSQVAPNMPAPVTGSSAVVNPFANTGNAHVTLGLKPVPAFEGMPHPGAQSTVVAQAQAKTQTPVQSQVPVQPATVEQPEIQPFNQAGFVQAQPTTDARFANGIRRVPSGLGSVSVTAPELTPSVQRGAAAFNQDALSSPLYNTTPEAYAGYTQTPPQKHHALMWVVILFLFAAGAGTAAAQFLGYNIIPRSFLSTIGLAPAYREPNELFERIIMGASDIQSGSYSITLGAKAVPRTSSDVPFKQLNSAADSVMFKRDSARLKDAGAITRALKTVYAEQRAYPYTIDNLKVPTKDSMGNPYTYTRGANGQSFELAVTLESSAMIEAVDTLYYMKGATVLLNGTSSDITYLSQTKPTSHSLFNQDAIASMFQYVSADLDAALKFSGTFDRRDAAGDFATTFAAHYQNTGMNESLQIDFRKKGAMIFARLAVIPNLLIALSGDQNIKNLEGKWAGDTLEALKKDDDFAWVYSTLGQSRIATSSSKENDTTQIGKQVGYVIKAYRDHNLLRYRTTPRQEVVNGVTAYRYDLTIDYSRIPSFVEAIKAKLDAEYGDKSITSEISQATIDYLRSEAFMNEARYLDEHTSALVWVTPQDQIVKISNTSEFVPDISTRAQVNGWQSKKAVISFVSELSNLNGKVTVETPKDYISLAEYKKLYFGLTDEEVILVKKMSHQEKIVASLRSYKNINKVYPDKLDQLVGPLASRSTPLTADVLIDPSTQKQYAYRPINKGSDFELMVDIALPQRVTNKSVLIQITALSVLKKSLVNDLSVVNGSNVFTSKSNLSVQRQKIGTKDTDGDGYSDALEKLMGRNPLKADSGI